MQAMSDPGALPKRSELEYATIRDRLDYLHAKVPHYRRARVRGVPRSSSTAGLAIRSRDGALAVEYVWSMLPVSKRLSYGRVVVFVAVYVDVPERRQSLHRRWGRRQDAAGRVHSSPSGAPTSHALYTETIANLKPVRLQDASRIRTRSTPMTKQIGCSSRGEVRNCLIYIRARTSSAISTLE